MEIFLSAVCGELASRSLSFFIDKYSKPPSALAIEKSLQRILLRSQVIIEEASGRDITNQGMLQQLSMLRDAMHRGYYLLDSFRYQDQAHKEEGAATAGDQVVSTPSSSSAALSKLNYARFLNLSSKSRWTVEELQEVLDDLNARIVDMSELVVFLKSYPRLYRQPYCMHLILDKCMFGRQMEMESVIRFLLRTRPHGDHEFDILPIVGPGNVGKSTLIAHVCKDERVRDRFSQILVLTKDDFKDVKLAALRERYARTHQNGSSKENLRSLIVVEVFGDMDQNAWKILCFAYKRWATSGSKIIITSRSDKIMKFGTTQGLTLKPLSDEAYWYFFKVTTFGSIDPELHPKLAYLAMEMAKTQNRSFTAAICISLLLRTNFNIHFWCKVLALLRGNVQKSLSKFGGHPCDLLHTDKPNMYLRRMGAATEDLFFSDQYLTCSQEDLPKTTLQDVLAGNTKPHGTFKALAWRSQIPPYNSCIYTCEIRELQAKVVKRKRYLAR